MKYRFRSECIEDILNLRKQLDLVGIENSIDYSQKDDGFPDTDATIDTIADLNSIRKVMRSVQDGHVMVQTVAPSDEYTGDRDYAL